MWKGGKAMTRSHVAPHEKQGARITYNGDCRPDRMGPHRRSRNDDASKRANRVLPSQIVAVGLFCALHAHGGALGHMNLRTWLRGYDVIMVEKHLSQ